MGRIAILSDSHDQVSRLASVVDLLRTRGIDTAVHCGDITSPRAVEALSGLSVHWVFGNCDFDREALRAAMVRCGHVCHGWRGELTLGTAGWPSPTATGPGSWRR
jgi:Predicted phosphoesterase